MMRVNSIQLNNNYRSNITFKTNNENKNNNQDSAMSTVDNASSFVDFKQNLNGNTGTSFVQKLRNMAKSLFSPQVSDEIARLELETFRVLT